MHTATSQTGATLNSRKSVRRRIATLHNMQVNLAGLASQLPFGICLHNIPGTNMLQFSLDVSKCNLASWSKKQSPLNTYCNIFNIPRHFVLVNPTDTLTNCWGTLDLRPWKLSGLYIFMSCAYMDYKLYSATFPDILVFVGMSQLRSQTRNRIQTRRCCSI